MNRIRPSGGSDRPMLTDQHFGVLIVDFPHGVGEPHTADCPQAEALGATVFSLPQRIGAVRLDVTEFPGLGAFVNGFGLDHPAGADVRPTPYDESTTTNHTVSLYDNLTDPNKKPMISSLGVSSLGITSDPEQRVTISFQITQIGS